MLFSCKTEIKESRRALASVGESKLYWEEVAPLLSGATSREDSLFRLKKYVATWIENELLSQEARQKLSKKEQDSIRQEALKSEKIYLANYLLTKVFSESGDTALTEQDQARVYQNIKENFPAEQNHYQYNFVLPSNWRTAQRLKALFHRNETKKIKEIVNSAPYIQSYSFDTLWVTEDSLRNFFKKIRVNLPQIQAREIPYVAWAIYKKQRSILIMKIFEEVKKGEPLPLEIIRKEIAPIVFSVKQKQFFEKYINRLKNENKKHIYITSLDNLF